jgi:hypothetical protein
MKVKWFWFTPAKDGFDIIVREKGAENGPVLAEVGVRGKQFEAFIDDILLQGAEEMSLQRSKPLPVATSEDWSGEPAKPASDPDEETAPDEPEEEKKNWF